MKALTAISFLVLILSGCNPAKRINKQQQQYQKLVDEYIKDHPPRIDTAVIIIKGKDSSSFFKLLADSLANIKAQTKAEYITKYKDTCSTANQIFDNGYNLGYQVGVFDTKAKQSPCDTFKLNQTPVDYIETLKRSIARVERENSNLQGQLFAEKNQTNYLWHFIISMVVATLLLIALLYKTFRK